MSYRRKFCLDNEDIRQKQGEYFWYTPTSIVDEQRFLVKNARGQDSINVLCQHVTTARGRRIEVHTWELEGLLLDLFDPDEFGIWSILYCSY